MRALKTDMKQYERRFSRTNFRPRPAFVEATPERGAKLPGHLLPHHCLAAGFAVHTDPTATCARGGSATADSRWCSPDGIATRGKRDGSVRRPATNQGCRRDYQSAPLLKLLREQEVAGSNTATQPRLTHVVASCPMQACRSAKLSHGAHGIEQVLGGITPEDGPAVLRRHEPEAERPPAGRRVRPTGSGSTRTPPR